MNGKRQHNGILLGTIALLIVTTGMHLPSSFFQKQRELIHCDALCYGYYQSLKSGLTLIGAVVIGYLSDNYGRSNALAICVVASLASCLISMSEDTVAVLFLAQIPSGLDQAHATMNALFSDYANNDDFSETERAAALGYLGMVAGIAFMFGPIAGAILFTSYAQAKIGACVFVVVGGVLMAYLPTPRCSECEATCGAGRRGGIESLLRLFSVQSAGTRLLLLMRVCMGLAFTVYHGLFMASLHTRFSFSPMQYALLMAWIGLSYALAQGVVAKWLIKVFRNDTKLLLCCFLVAGVFRFVQIDTASVPVLYISMFLVIGSVGVMHTLLATACSMIADSSSVGGLYGGMEAAEKLAGLVGPALGGFLHSVHPLWPVVLDIALFTALFVSVRLCYQKLVVSAFAVHNR
jgi:MFS transporter, DHA1 family, tetracycline resistance protein